ncbi:hypothetical protein L1049_011684 [Liquidambar formosana]|uniref:Uncharacterized protein n=1 Tax=Liquidambar formosana TaxID=63359 RepID=A0AAP0RX24_LIQFO
MDGVEDHEALFHSYPCDLYYVQSPSTLSHANSAADCRHNESTYHSPLRSDNFIITNPTITSTSAREASRFTLSHYSSSRGSNNSFLQEKKIVYDLQSHENDAENGEKCRIIVGTDVVEEEKYEDDFDDDDEKDDVFYGRKGGHGWWKYFSFRTSSSCGWICLQISWRLMLSLGLALLVFFIVTKPPPPKLSIKMAGIRQFGLGEGVDASGIPTKILTCNCSMELLIDNKSKTFGLHIHPPLMEMSFGRLPFALSRGPELYAESYGSTLFQLYVGTRNRPMYAAGRDMEDMLESGHGLPLVIRVSLRSSFRVVWSLIEPKFHHQAECLLVLDSSYDKKHQTQAYNSSCIISS